MKKTLLFLILMMVSTNLFAQWVTVNPNTADQNIIDVWFADANNGYIIGWLNTASRTTDGGNTWIKLKLPTQAFYTYTTDFFDINHFVVCTNSGLLFTSDGGTTWRNVNGTFGYAFFRDMNNGWATNDNILCKTTDGGYTWSRSTVANNTRVTSVYFTTPNSGWAGCEDGSVYRTINGGASWTKISKLNASVTRLLVRNDNLAFACTKSAIFRTTNGGNKWDSKFTGTSYGKIQFLNDTTAFYATGSGLIKTTDMGATWNDINFDVSTVQTNYSINTNSFFLNEQAGWVCGTYGQLAKTTNAGESWINLSKGMVGNLAAIKFPTPNIGYALGQYRTMLKSTDGGLNWQEITKLDSGTYVSLAFENETKGWAVSDKVLDIRNSSIFGTTNGGESWNIQFVDPSLQFNYICSVSPGKAIAVGKAGVCMVTENGGASWSRKNLGIVSDVSYVYFFNSQIGFMCHASGMLGTKDGGTTWDAVAPSIFIEKCNYVQMLTAQIGFCSKGESLFKTTDGGSTWSVVGACTNEKFCFLDENVGYIINNIGHVKSTKNGGKYWTDSDRLVFGNVRDLEYMNDSIVYICGDYSSILRHKKTVIPKLTVYFPESDTNCVNLRNDPLWFSWSNLAYELGTTFQLQISTDPNFATVDFEYQPRTNEFVFADNLLKYDKKYYWRVRAINGETDGPWSEVRNFKTIVGPVAAISPKVGEENVPQSVRLQWAATEGVTEYHVQLSKNPAVLEDIIVDLMQTENFVDISGLERNTVYYWRVSQFKECGSSNWSNIFTFSTIPYPPLAPKLSVPDSNQCDLTNWVTLRWAPGEYTTDIIGYDVELSLDPSFTNLVDSRRNLTGTGYTFNLPIDKTIYWRVRSQNVGGYSEWSNVWLFTMKDIADYWEKAFSNSMYINNGVTFVDAQNGWVACNPALIQKTTNGGNSWEPVFSQMTDRLYAICFLDAKNGWAVGCDEFSYEGNIYRTTDGTNFSRVLNDSCGLSDIKFADKKTGWAAGANGVIFRTVDGGNKWTRQSQSQYKVLRRLMVMNPRRAWAVGDNGYNLRTIDGVNWNSFSIMDKTINAMAFTDSLNLWCVGNNGFIAYSSDGGENWAQQATCAYANLKDIKMVDKDYGWAIGVEGVAIRTTDGGKHWSLKGTSTNKYLYSLCLLDREHGWASGMDGAVIRLASHPTGTDNEPTVNTQGMQSYPNPASGIVTIRYNLETPSPVDIDVFNSLGERVLRAATSHQSKEGENEFSTDVSELSAGAYYCVVRSNHSQQIVHFTVFR